MDITKTLLVASSSILLLVGCGGSSSSSDSTTPVDPMTEKDAILIVYHYPAELCESDLLANEIATTIPEAENVLIRVESNDVTCATYGKVEGVTDTEGCAVEDAADFDSSLLQYDTSCVIGFDLTASTQWSTAREDIALEMSFALDTMD